MVCLWVQRLSPRTGEEHPETDVLIPSDDSHLLILSSLQEFLYWAAGGLPHWIGLTKTGSEGHWYWVDDTPFDKVQSLK